MRSLHTVQISVFCKPNENRDAILKAFILFLPFDLEKERIVITEEKAEGLENKVILIFKIELVKENHTRRFIEHLLSKLSTEDKKILLSQTDTILDNECNFFIRIDKEKLIEEKKFIITHSGNCFHIKMNVACFPKKKSVALEVVKKIIDGK